MDHNTHETGPDLYYWNYWLFSYTISADKIVPLGNTTFKVENKDVYLSPVYHLMDSKVWSGTNYKKQILF